MQPASNNWDRLVTMAADEVAAIIRSLPDKLKEPATQVPVVYEPRPSQDLLNDGIDADTLGLFVGPDFVEEYTGSVSLPPQIFLFLENLWDVSGEDETIYREEIQTTYMHELGHYLGLDEDDLTDRGLE